MYQTIMCLSQMDAESALYFEDILNEDNLDKIFGDFKLVDDEYFKYLKGEGTTKEQFRRIVELTENGTKIKNGATGFSIRGHEIYYDRDNNQFYYEYADYSKYTIPGGARQMIYIPPKRYNLEPEYLLENIEDITWGKVHGEGIYSDIKILDEFKILDDIGFDDNNINDILNNIKYDDYNNFMG